MELRATILGRLVRESSEEVMLEQKPEWGERVRYGVFGRRVIKAERRVYANAQRWGWAWSVWGSTRRFMWLELNEDRRGQRNGQWQDYVGPLASECSSPPSPSVKLGMWMSHPETWLHVSLISFPFLSATCFHCTTLWSWSPSELFYFWNQNFRHLILWNLSSLLVS